MHVEFSGSFSDYTIFICKFKIGECFFYLWNVFRSQLETFKNCKEVNHIMIMIIAMIYIFFIICDIWSTVENYFQKIISPSPPEKIHSPLLTHSPLEIQKVQVPPLFANIKKISPPSPCRKGGGHCLISLMFPRLAINFLKESVSKFCITSRYMARLDRQVDMIPYRFISFL